MKPLRECRNLVRPIQRNWEGTLESGPTKLTVRGDQPFALYPLDDDALMGRAKKCDGLLVTEKPPPGGTCFIELKGAIDPQDPDRPFEQIQSSIDRFAPLPGGTRHGEARHVQWRSGEDLPDAPRKRGSQRTELAVAAQHNVTGVIVTSRGGTRYQPRWITVAGRNVLISILQRHGTYGRVEVDVNELADSVVRRSF